MSPYRVDVHDPSTADSLSFPPLRPRWPYGLGQIAGVMFGLCLLVILAAIQVGSDSAERVSVLAVVGAVLAGLLLGIAWIGVLRAGQGGAAPIAGSFALPLAFIYLYFNHSPADMSTLVALVVGAFAAFSWGHAVAPCGVATRMLAVMSALLWSFLFVAAVKPWHVPEMLAITALLVVALTSICLAFSFGELRHAAPRHEADPGDPDWC